jgi:hypothetical protein
VARIAEPNLGSVREGLEKKRTGIAAAKHEAAHRMDRKSWDWPRLLKHAEQLFTNDVPVSVKKCKRPVFVRIVCHQPARGEVPRSSRTFVLYEDRWFERHGRETDTKAMTAYLREVDKRPDWWVVVYIGCDFSPNEIEGMAPAQATDVLMCFANVRDRLHK